MSKIKHSYRVTERVQSIEDPTERAHVASILHSLDRYGQGERELDTLSDFPRMLVNGDVDAWFKADLTNRKHFTTILWFVQWDMPANKTYLLRKKGVPA